MDIKQTLVVYSKYSQACTSFLPILDMFPDHLKESLKLSPLCADHPKVRKIVQSSGIIAVPCIQIVYSSKKKERYEGQEAFEWAQTIINRFSPQSTGRAPNPVPEQQPQRESELEELKAKILTMEQLLEKSQKVENTQDDRKREKQEKRKNVTSLDLLPSVSDDDGETEELVEDTESAHFELSERKERKTFADIKSDAVKNSAAEMQKQREELEESFAKGRRPFI